MDMVLTKDCAFKFGELNVYFFDKNILLGKTNFSFFKIKIDLRKMNLRSTSSCKNR